MRLPFSWLNDFVKIPDPPEEAARKLRNVGVPVEKVEYLNSGIHKIFAGKIIELKAHPNADKLRIAQVDLGKEKRQIITGAPNVALGDAIPVAVTGATLAGGKTIQETILRGLPSSGMMCSANELGLDLKEYLPVAQREGVMILEPSITPGTNLEPVFLLNEAIFVLEPFANRPDFLNVFGIAREAAAIYGATVKLPELYPEKKGNLKDKIQVEIQNPEACPRYIARHAANLHVKPSPLWMALRLVAAGIRPINNAVDITNYVLLELGQPLHAFDYQKLSDKKIQVRQALRNETIIALDGKSYKLPNQALVIADGNKAVAIAGIIGGQETEISENTKELLLESAVFNPGAVRRTSFSLGLRTEGSKRFEKGLDPIGADWGSRRACYFLEKEGVEISNGVEDAHEKLPQPPAISVSFARMKAFLGIPNLTFPETEKILTGLAFRLKSGEPFHATPPPLRLDIHEDADIFEEVARHYGYDRIPSTLPKGSTTPASVDSKEQFEEKLRDVLIQSGLTEMMSYSLSDPIYFSQFDEHNLALIQNPLTEDRKALRPLLYPGLISALRKNIRIKMKDLNLFEIGRIFQSNQTLHEKRNLAVILSGKLPWGNAASFFTLKGILEQLWRKLHITPPFRLNPSSTIQFHPLRGVSVECEKKTIGFAGELHPNFLESFDISEPVLAMELSIDELQSLNAEIKIQPIPLYPESRRDISLLLDRKVPAGDVAELIRKHGDNRVEDVTIFDVYQGPQVPENKKSIALAVIYRSPEKTLTDEEVNGLHGRIQEALTLTFQATLR